MVIVLNPTKECNMTCRYCYSENSNDKILSLKTFNIIVEKFTDYYDNVEYSWHGGEPLLMEKNYFSNIIEVQNNYYKSRTSKSFYNSIQTNGYLLTPHWYEFLTSLNFDIIVSYDGINSVRLFKNNQSTHERVTKNIKQLKNGNNNSLRITCVLSKDNIDTPHEIYRHFKQLNISSFSLLPYFGEDKSLKIYNTQYYKFHKTLFEIWRNDNDKIIKNILPLSQILNSILKKGNEKMCSWKGKCFENIHCIEPNGDIYLCSGLFKPNHKIGNILTDELHDVYESVNFQRAIMSQYAAINECSNCEVMNICNSGCRIASYYSNGNLGTKDPLCEGRKNLIEYISQYVMNFNLT